MYYLRFSPLNARTVCLWTARCFLGAWTLGVQCDSSVDRNRWWGAAVISLRAIHSNEVADKAGPSRNGRMTGGGPQTEEQKPQVVVGR